MSKLFKFKGLVLVIVIAMLLVLAAGCGSQETTSTDAADSPRTLSVIFFDWIPQYDEYAKTIETAYEALHPDIDLQIIDLPGYYDTLDTTTADVYELDEMGLYQLYTADRLQPLADEEVPDPDDYFPICKDVAYIDGTWWGVPHWTCTYFMYYNKNDTELAAAQTFSDLEEVIGGKDHPYGQGLLINMSGDYTQYYYQDALVDLYGNATDYFKYNTASNMSPEATDVMKRIVDMMDAGTGRDPLSNKIFDDLERQFIYGNGRAYVYYAEGLGYMNEIIKQAQNLGDTTLTLDDIAIKPFVESDDGDVSQPGFVDSFCLDKSLTGQKRADAMEFINWVTSTEEVVKQIAPTPDSIRYVSPARISVYEDPGLLEICPLYEQLKPVLALASYYRPAADWDWAPGLNDKLDSMLPVK